MVDGSDKRVQFARAAGAIIGTWHLDLPTDRFTIDEGFENPYTDRVTLGAEREIFAKTAFGLDFTYAEGKQLLPLAAVSGEACDAGAAGADAGTMGGGQSGEVGREQHGGRFGDQDLLLELVCVGGACARLEHGARELLSA